MYHFEPYNAFLTIATNIPQRLKNGFVLQGHILKRNVNKWAQLLLGSLSESKVLDGFSLRICEHARVCVFAIHKQIVSHSAAQNKENQNGQQLVRQQWIIIN